MIAHSPLHGSGRAELPHPALALGNDAHAAQRIGMADRRHWHAIPEASHLEPKEKQRRSVHGHSVITNVSTHHRLQPLAQLRDGFMHAPLKFGFHFAQPRLQPFAYGLPKNRIHSVASLLHADVRKAKEVERLRFPFSASLPVVEEQLGRCALRPFPCHLRRGQS